MKTPTTVIARKNPYACVKGVMLRLSKGECGKAFARMLRVPQHDTALGFVIAVMFCLLLSVNALAQSKDTSAKAKPLDSVVNKDALYVIDGVLSHNKLNGIDPHDILSINVIKQDTAFQYFDGPIRNGPVVVVTKQGAIKSYQKRFSAFSKKYKDYLDKHNGDDKNLVYILNGVPVQGKPNYIIETLYKVSPEKIKNVSFNQNEIDIEHGTAAVIINLKDVIMNLNLK